MVRIRRVASTTVLLAVAAASLSACNTAALSKQELVVYFTPGTTSSQKLAALHNCAHVTPEATPEAVSKSTLVSNQVGDIRFRIDHADDKQVSILEDCLHKQVGIEGVDIPDYTD